MIRGLALAAPSSDLQEGKKGLEGELIMNGQWFNQSCVWSEASTNIPELGGLEGFQVGEYMEVLKGGTLREGTEAPGPGSYLAPCISSILLILSCILL